MSSVVLSDKPGSQYWIGDLRTKSKEVKKLTMWIFGEKYSR